MNPTPVYLSPRYVLGETEADHTAIEELPRSSREFDIPPQALSRLPASFLPYLVGVGYAVFALGIDDFLLGTEALLPESEARAVLAEHLACTEDSATGPEDRRRMLAALDHRFVSVDASDVCVRGKGPAGAHSDHLRPETAHLLLSLADHSR
ncbi:hypothetical protein GCM10010211_33470 [Streptomyces albospinus]|uniref:Uncharacterized protein n=1 Tax=Streptomyces albospinus TaxID=285515 RepID=A0ABQ2V291_9ACTN|nr:hypothetical protein [Streptomyces albospinus]GGU65590.1 hypothetical protein GCM10010211_33470 [Streptomyces albospinus]